MPFDFQQTDIPEVVHIIPKQFPDQRGIFAEIYKRSDFAGHGITEPFVQFNYSESEQGVLRGLHYQKQPHAQDKLISVVSGEIFDVAVDMRKGSPTYGQWVGRTLNDDTKEMLYVPVGFAHGFVVTSERARVMYYVTSEYAPESEGGLHWNDAAIGIEWPVDEPTVAERDAAFPPLAEADHNFTYEQTD